MRAVQHKDYPQVEATFTGGFCYTGCMLTEREVMYVYALWQKRVEAGKYLKDIPPGDLTIQELCDLIPSAFYAKEQLMSIPEKKKFTRQLAGVHSGIVIDLIQKHRKNSSI